MVPSVSKATGGAEGPSLVTDQGAVFHAATRQTQDKGAVSAPEKDRPETSGGKYVFTHPASGTKPSAHFSSLLLSADVPATCLELSLYCGLTYIAYHPHCPHWVVDVPGSMRLREVGRCV